jgi:hypothetical protein
MNQSQLRKIGKNVTKLAKNRSFKRIIDIIANINAKREYKSR